MNDHEYGNGRVTTSTSSLLMNLPCDNPVRGNGFLRMYYGDEGKHRLEREDGDICCGGGGNWGHEWNCRKLRASWPQALRPVPLVIYTDEGWRRRQ